MATPARPDERPLLWLLQVMTFVSGVADAVSYLGLNHVFVANMTGNVAFLGFAVVGEAGFSPVGSILALAAFLLGATSGGWVARRGRTLLAVRNTALLQLLAFAISLALALTLGLQNVAYAVIALLSLTMGMQSAIARSAGLDVTTTVLTMTMASLASEPHIRGPQPRTGRRVAAVVVMFAGAAAGALVFRFAPPAAIGLAAVCAALASGGAQLALRR